MKTLVVPPSASASVADLLSGTGWELDAADGAEAHDVGATLALLGRGRGLVVVPSSAAVPASLRRVLVLHDGTPGSTPAVEAADHIAVRHGSGVVVVHPPDVEKLGDGDSLTMPRVADHSPYDWQEWRDEFLRRFCPVSSGVSVAVELVNGPPVEGTLDVVAEERADLVVAAWDGDLETRRAEALQALLSHSPCPVLVVPGGDERGEPHPPAKS
ncbi:MAG TPA: universal stress protein [Acidimicrobiales bacterium]|nr:universal stress protein [Acidimicrobiales bacterium]